MDICATVLDNYQVRKTKKQKKEFGELVNSYAKPNGYPCRTEKGLFGAKNIIVGDPEKAKVVYTAHYDTCPQLPIPNFITPNKFSIYLLYQLLLVLGIFVLYFGLCFIVGAAIGVALALLDVDPEAASPFLSLISLICFITVYALFFAGPANKHTANDNTSGVVTLLEIMRRMPEEKRESAAFIFFDLEESGLFGSSGYASKHKAEKKDKLIVNFDCVSDGNHILFVLCKGAKNDRELLGKYFESNEDFNVEIHDKGVFYPSDQANFNRGVGVAALKYSKKLKTLYMDRIHTSKDVIFDEKNIEYLSTRAAAMASEME